MLKWPGFLPRLMVNAMPPRLWFFKFDGAELFSLSDVDRGRAGIISMPLWRHQLHEELFRYAAELGIPVTFDRGAVAYGEDDGRGFVLTEDGARYEADLVIAADGIASRSAEMIVSWNIYLTPAAFTELTKPHDQPGKRENPTSSGYAIYRKSYPLGKHDTWSLFPGELCLTWPADHALQDPEIAKHWGGDEEGVQVFLGDNIHLVTAKNSKTNSVNKVLLRACASD